MLKRPLQLAALLVLASPLSVHAETAAESALGSFLTGVTSLKARFEQVSYSSDREELERASGDVWLRRPGRFRWDYVEPYPQEIVSDGASVWMFDPDLEQVTVRTLSAEVGETPAALLTGDDSVLERFNVVDETQAEGLQWVHLEPAGSQGDFSRVSVGFAGETLARMEFRDQLNQITGIDFLDLEVNPEIDPGLFTFEIPEGADVIDESGP